MTDWYGSETRLIEIVSRTAVCYHAGLPPAPIRWVLVRDPSDQREPQAFLSTNLDDTPAEILGCFVSRWRVETTFQEVRRHLGVGNCSPLESPRRDGGMNDRLDTVTAGTIHPHCESRSPSCPLPG